MPQGAILGARGGGLGVGFGMGWVGDAFGFGLLGLG